MQKKHFSLFFMLVYCFYFSPIYLNEGQSNSNVENTLQENDVIRSVIPADITFMIADLKYSSHHLKIIEFGGGPGAGFKVLDHLYSPGKVWRSFWINLKRFHLPIIYIGPKKNLKKIAWENLKKMAGYYFPSFKIFTNSYLFNSLQKTKIFKKYFFNLYL